MRAILMTAVGGPVCRQRPARWEIVHEQAERAACVLRGQVDLRADAAWHPYDPRVSCHALTITVGGYRKLARVRATERVDTWLSRPTATVRGGDVMTCGVQQAASFLSSGPRIDGE
jgi:hypothetical protein